MTRYLVCLFGLILLVIAACTPSLRPTESVNVPVQTQPTSAAVVDATLPPAAIPTGAPTLAPQPRNVQVKVDSQISASAEITATGGTLSVQGADGTKYTLTFPEDALFEDTEVTLTPLTGVDGLPFSGGLVGGVQMAPEGLRLFKPATLSIESTKAAAAAGYETVAFAYHQNGEGMYLTPSDIKGNVLTLEVWHFSGAGAAQGTAAEIQAQQQNVPSNDEDAFVQHVREYISRERQAQLLGQEGDPELGKKMTEFSREYYDRFVAPQLPLALEDCEAAPAILSKALGWLRQVYLLGIGNEFQSEQALINETLQQATVNCYNKEYDKCLIDNDIKHRAVMLGHLRVAALFGFEDRLDFDKIYKCPPLHYRVDTVMGIYSTVPVTGDICSLDVPFTLKVNGHNPSGGQYVGDIVFTPTDTSGGSWKHTATSCIPGYGCGDESGGSTYQLAGVADGKPVLMMNATTASSAIKGYVGVYDWPAWQIELQSATGACSE